jgi:hypothetical protein
MARRDKGQFRVSVAVGSTCRSKTTAEFNFVGIPLPKTEAPVDGEGGARSLTLRIVLVVIAQKHSIELISSESNTNR